MQFSALRDATCTSGKVVLLEKIGELFIHIFIEISDLVAQ